MKARHATAILAASLALTGCKLTLISPEGGSIASGSGNRDCGANTLCNIDIDSAVFSDTFTANPEPGYEFVQWQNGDGFWCAGSTSPTCELTLSGSAAETFAVASFKIIYAMPVYEHVGIDTDNDGVRNELDEDDDNDGLLDGDDPCPLDSDPLCTAGVPITDTLFSGGKEWAVPATLGSFDWAEIDAACPEGTCSGQLGNWNMEGWTWASLEDANDLYNYYIAPVSSQTMGPGPDVYTEDASVSPNAYSAFSASGWPSVIFVWTSTDMDSSNAYITVAAAPPNPFSSGNVFLTNLSESKATQFSGLFFRQAQ